MIGRVAGGVQRGQRRACRRDRFAVLARVGSDIAHDDAGPAGGQRRDAARVIRMRVGDEQLRQRSTVEGSRSTAATCAGVADAGVNQRRDRPVNR